MSSSAAAAGPSSPGGAASSEDPTANRLLDRAKEIRNSQPQWTSFGHVASAETLALVESFASDPASRKKMLDANNTEAIAALLALFDKLTNLSTVQFVVTLLDDILEEQPNRVDAFVAAGASTGQSTIDTFVKKLGRTDDIYICMVSANVVARLIRGGADIDATSLRAYYNWLNGELRTDDKNRFLPALTCLARTFRRTRFRIEFCRDEALLTTLQALVSVDSPVQQQYQSVLCCWTLAFSSEAIAAMGDIGAKLVTQVSDILTSAKKEKVIRVSLAFLRNMLENANSTERAMEFAVLMIGHRLLPIVKTISSHGTYSDEELKDDAETLAEKLAASFDHMSTYDEYTAEVRSGKLSWSPVHRSERFWRENAEKLNDKKHEILKLLLAYLKKSDDAISVAVAVHDCGQYVTHYPYGRQALGELGHKAMIMDLMNHEDSTIRYEALIAVQKMMTDNWEYLGKKVKQEAEKT